MHFTRNPLFPRAFTPRVANHKISTETKRHSNETTQRLSSSKLHSNALADSCEIILKSREDILGIKNMPLHTPHSQIELKKAYRDFSHQKAPLLNELSPHKGEGKGNGFAREERKGRGFVKKMLDKAVTPTGSNKYKVFDFTEQLSAKEISEGVIYGYNGIGFKNCQSNTKLQSTRMPLNELKREILERKQRIHRYQQEIIKSLETKQGNSFDEDEVLEQAVYSQPADRVSFGAVQQRVRTRPDAERGLDTHEEARARVLTVEVEEQGLDAEGRIRRPYVGKRVNTKSGLYTMVSKVKKQYLIM
eukprot:TRINITY_DN5644_c0_g1_i3.p1 TRINITY_DN5644_c0_g1~~TRINITY_DN5644_c0_g1_i3.p1  ORF type:complete len:304 (-),score=46.97 TRINITY_DN5644_c0_g1_i3:134-1045(-)